MESLYYCLLLFVIVFTSTFFLIPKIRHTALKFNLADMPSVRGSHLKATPSFGGVAFYVSFAIALFIIQFFDDNQISLTLLISISVLFFTGVLDDLLYYSAKVKFLGQLLGVAVLMFQPDFRILTLHGFMGIYEISVFASIVGSMFFLLGLINAFNLLDGVDSLSATTGIIIASFYSIMCYHLGCFYYLYLAVTTIAMLPAFLWFNFSITKKIFAGDIGRLSIGLVLGLLTLKLMSSGSSIGSSALNFDQNQLPLLLLAVLFVPILDTCIAMLIRAFKRESMFKSDRNHIHHIIIDFGLSHRRASFFIGLVNFSVGLLMFFVITNFKIVQSTVFLFGLFAASIALLFLMNKNRAALRLKVKIKKSMSKIFFY